MMDSQFCYNWKYSASNLWFILSFFPEAMAFCIFEMSHYFLRCWDNRDTRPGTGSSFFLPLSLSRSLMTQIYSIGPQPTFLCFPGQSLSNCLSKIFTALSAYRNHTCFFKKHEHSKNTYCRIWSLSIYYSTHKNRFQMDSGAKYKNKNYKNSKKKKYRLYLWSWGKKGPFKMRHKT